MSQDDSLGDVLPGGRRARICAVPRVLDAISVRGHREQYTLARSFEEHSLIYQFFS